MDKNCGNAETLWPASLYGGSSKYGGLQGVQKNGS
jgi:hypothetical protein